MMLSDILLAALYNRLNYKGQRSIKDDLQEHSLFNVTLNNDTSYTARYINTLIAMFNERQHVADAQGALHELGYHLEEYTVDSKTQMLINASLIYMSPVSSVLNTPVFVAKIDYDSQKQILSPRMFAAYQQSFAQHGDEDAFKDVSEFTVNNYSMDDLGMVMSGDNSYLLHSNSEVAPQVSAILNIHLPFDVHGKLPQLQSYEEGDLVQWLK